MTVQETFDNFILSRRLADYTPKTVSNYVQFVRPFVAAVGSQTDFQSLHQEDINAYLSGLLARPVSKSTRATYIRHLKAFLHWAADEYGAQYRYASIKVPKTPKKEVRIYTDDEILAIFQAVSCSVPWLSCRNRVIVAMMYDSGLRQAEICGLRRAWLSLSDGRMKVYGKGDKERTVPLGLLTKKLLSEYLAVCPYDSDLVFVSKDGAPVSCNSIKQMMTKAARRLPFELSSHKLRHNFATNYCIDQYEKHGRMDIYSLMYLMGHEQLSTTERYLHYAQEIIAARQTVSHLDKLALVI